MLLATKRSLHVELLDYINVQSLVVTTLLLGAVAVKGSIEGAVESGSISIVSIWTMLPLKSFLCRKIVFWIEERCPNWLICSDWWNTWCYPGELLLITVWRSLGRVSTIVLTWFSSLSITMSAKGRLSFLDSTNLFLNTSIMLSYDWN